MYTYIHAYTYSHTYTLCVCVYTYIFFNIGQFLENCRSCFHYLQITFINLKGTQKDCNMGGFPNCALVNS